MDSETEIFRILGMVFLLSVAVVAISITVHSHMWYDSWNKCVDAGGQPSEQSMVGRNSSALTCIRK